MVRSAVTASALAVAMLAAGAGSSHQQSGARKASPIPDVRLVTHEGRAVRYHRDLVQGRTVVINFTFSTCENFCPITMPNLAQLQKLLGDRVGRDIHFHSITLDPQGDTPPLLRKYAANLGAGPGWTFLTGDEAEITRLRRRLGVYNPDPEQDADRTQHAGVVVYGNDAINRWGSMPGLIRPEQMASAVLLVADAAVGQGVTR